MKTTWVLLACLLLQSAAAQTTVFEDSTGDVQLSANNEDVAALPGQDAIDHEYLKITETRTDLIFHLGLAAVGEPADQGLADRLHQVFFQQGDSQFVLFWSELVGGSVSAGLQQYDEGLDRYNYLGAVTHEADAEANELRWTVPREWLLDSRGAPPFPGRAIEEIRVQSESPYLVSNLASLFPSLVTGDRTLVVLEDQSGPGAFEVVLGVEQEGAAVLGSDDPFRFSNGEASTFVFWVNATFSGERETVFDLATVDVPAGWTVRLPAQQVTMQPGLTTRLPVVLDTPFAHAHGERESFVLELRADGHVGRVELGILYPLIAQPAGHHDLLHFHSQPYGEGLYYVATAPPHRALFGNNGDETAYMNTAKEDDRDLQLPVDMVPCVNSASEGESFCLDIPLDPGLKMGLDFRLGELADLAFDLHAPIPFQGVTVQAFLDHIVVVEEQVGPGFSATYWESQRLAQTEVTAPLDMPAGQTASFELPMEILEGADLVKYDRRAGMELTLLVKTSVPGPGLIFSGVNVEPQLMPGGTLRLPLEEYRDPIDVDAILASDISWFLGTESERPVNAGETVVFSAALRNTGEPDSFDMRVVGAQQEWAEWLGPTSATLGTNETVEVLIAVSPPASALPGDLADLVLEAASVTDVTSRALMHIRAVVVEEDVPDESGLAVAPDSGKESPVAPTALVLAMLAILVARSKRS